MSHMAVLRPQTCLEPLKKCFWAPQNFLKNFGFHPENGPRPRPAGPGRPGPSPPGTSGAPTGSLTVELGPGTVANRSGGHILSGKIFQPGFNSPCSPRYGPNTDFGPVWADLGAHWAGPGSGRPAPAPAPKNSFCQFAGTGGTFWEKVRRPFLCSFPSRIVWSKKFLKTPRLARVMLKFHVRGPLGWPW